MRKYRSCIISIILLIPFVFACDQSEYNLQINHYQRKTNKRPRNIILMIGDGMGITQIYSGMTVSELFDFNRAIEVAMDFAKINKRTLVIVTADHETGGMALSGGGLNGHTVETAFTTKGHTGVMVPVFAFGPGADKFRGIYDNTCIFEKMNSLYGFKERLPNIKPDSRKRR